MAVTQLKDGRWVVYYQKGTHPEDPNRTREYFGRGLVGESAAYARNDELNLRNYNRQAPRQNVPTFGQLAAAYLQAKIGHIEPSTYENTAIKLDRIIGPVLGHLDANKITHAKLDRYVRHRIDKVKRVTVHRELSYITAILNWAVRRQMLHASPAAGYKPPKRDDDIILPPTQAEIAAILANAKGHLVRALITSYYTGIRPGKELYGIRWSDIDLDAGSILVRSARKGGPAFRHVPIHPIFARWLEAWLAQDDRLNKKYNQSGRPPVEHLIHYHGGPIVKIKSSWRDAKKKAGITRRLRLYDFRHAFATNILAAGGDLKSVSEMLGHSRPDTTVRIYQHTSTTLHRQSVKLLPDLPGPGDQ